MSNVTPSLPLSHAERVRIAESNLDRQLDWIGRYDAKSSVALGLITAMLGAVFATAPANPLTWPAAGIIAGGAAVAMLALSLLFLHRGNYPAMAGPPSLIFFGSVATLTLAEYRERLTDMGDTDYADDLIRQTHRVSQILQDKFRLLKWAYMLLFGSVPFWAASIYLLRFAAAGSATP